MASDVSICSAALMLLGDTPIASLDENTKRATMCRTIYTQAVEDVLRLHPWNCLITQVVLAPETTAPAFGYTAQFARPGDWLRTITVGDDNSGYADFLFVGNKIQANLSTLKLTYIARKDVSEWDSHLVNVITCRMAADLAYPVTKSGTMVDLRIRAYAMALKTAKAVDGQENQPEQIQDSPLIAVRG